MGVITNNSKIRLGDKRCYQYIYKEKIEDAEFASFFGIYNKCIIRSEPFFNLLNTKTIKHVNIIPRITRLQNIDENIINRFQQSNMVNVETKYELWD